MHLIKDEGVNYKIKNVGVEVYDLYSYLEARKLYAKYRNSSELIEIVITKKKLFNFFLDLEEDEKVIVETKYPRVKLDISLEEMKSLGIENIDEFYEISGGKDTFDKDLLNYHFNKEKNIFEVLKKLDNISYTNSKLLEIIARRYFSQYPLEMKSFFIEKPIEFSEKLVEGFVISRYSKLNYRILEIWKNEDETYRFYSKNKELEEQFLESYSEINLLNIDRKIRENHKKIDVYLNYDENKYLKNISGYLKFEKEFYMMKFIEKINKSENIENHKNNYFEFLEKFNLEKSSEIIKLLDRLEKINKIDLSSFENSKMSLEDWKKFYKDKYMILNNELEVDNTNQLIKSCERKYNSNLSELKEKLEAKWNYVDNKFQEYFLGNYNQLMSSETKEGLSYKLEEIKKLLQQDKKVFFLFIDCLRYDIWDSYKEEFQKRGYFIQNEDLTLSMIPTVTNHCKKILFTGKKYNEINKSTSYVNGLEEYFLDYKINSFSSVEEIDKEADINIYEVLEVDENIHNSKGLTLDYLKSILNHKLLNILNYIDDESNDATIVLCSDHGFMSINTEKKKQLTLRNYLKEKGLELENHGRYMSISGTYFDENIYNVLMENLSQEKEYTVIKRNELNNFYLKESISNKEIYCYILLKENYTLNTSNGCTHGGISLKEVMIPFVILEKKEKSYKPIKLEIINSKVTTNKNSEVTILVKNQNKIDELEVYLKYNGEATKIRNIEGNKLISIPVLIKQIGIIPDKIILEAMIQGKLEKVEVDIDINSIETKGSKLSKKMKKGRSLL